MTDPVFTYLSAVGLNVASATIYDVAKRMLQRTPTTTTTQLAQELTQAIPSLTLEGAEIVSKAAVEFMAKKGYVTISGTSITANDSITMFSAPGRSLTFGNGSESRTKNSSIVAGRGATIQANNGAGIVQHPDGSISFHC